jgi:hypothetical protein
MSHSQNERRFQLGEKAREPVLPGGERIEPEFKKIDRTRGKFESGL